eukprot:3381554-Lingulodinium_polyedra.AAC.1
MPGLPTAALATGRACRDLARPGPAAGPAACRPATGTAWRIARPGRARRGASRAARPRCARPPGLRATAAWRRRWGFL